MPLYEWTCDTCGHRETVACRIDDRNAFRPEHDHAMRRMIGGTGRMLYFEEGRPRLIQALGDKPITSEAQRARLARINGVTECGNTVPESVRRNPKSEAMQKFMGKDHGGRWI